jgi:Zn-dependent peptidase ImmA (M78 family)
VDQFATNRSFLETEAFLSRRHPERVRQLELVKGVASLKAKAKCYRFPTDVDRLAREAGIVATRIASLVTRGRLIREPGGFVVEIDSKLSPNQRRFVIAHEISHLMVERDLMLTSVGRPQRSKTQHRFVERLCDFGAREILLPINSLRHEIAELTPSLEIVCKIATEAQCSLELVAERIFEHPPIWNGCRFISWIVHKERLMAVRTWPEGGVDTEQISLNDEKNSIVMRALNTTGVAKGWQELSYAGREQQLVYLEAVASDESYVLSLYMFKRPLRNSISPTKECTVIDKTNT